MERKLTKKQEKFCKEYLLTGNATAAYRAAYDTSKMKDTTISDCAYELLKNPIIAPRIKKLQTITSGIAEKKFKVSSEELLSHLDILRKSSIDQYIEIVDVEGVIGFDEIEMEEIKITERTLRFKLFEDLTKEQLMCIESVKNTRNGIELKLHGKDWTIEKIAKHIGFYEKDNTQKAPAIQYQNVSKQFSEED